ncbi:MAG: SdiA-regulated domain-containing protein [Bacteroidota bacterium]
MYKYISFFILISTSFLFSNCKDNQLPVIENKPPASTQYGDPIPYQLDAPAHSFDLARDLKEISGLTYYSNKKNILAINDEKGKAFSLDPTSGKITERVDFGRSADYEGITHKNEEIFVVESNGDLIAFNFDEKYGPIKFKTKLSRKNDIEGICYNPSTSTLLLAAKGSGKISGKESKSKSIFSMDLESKKVSDIPFIKVNLEKTIEKLKKLEPEKFDVTNYQMTRARKFSPSGIAVHPVSNEIYVLSSRGKLLVVFNQKGELKSLQFLKDQLYTQPEGICFGPDNMLYISNEGRAGKATLLSFKPTGSN